MPHPAHCRRLPELRKLRLKIKPCRSGRAERPFGGSRGAAPATVFRDGTHDWRPAALGNALPPSNPCLDRERGRRMKIPLVVCMTVLLSGCGGSQSVAGAPSAGAQSATGSAERSSLKRYYLAKLTTVVGSSLPGSSLCFRFKPNGSWSSTGSVSFTGTYLTSGKQLYASALWLPSPAFFLTFEGSVNAKQGSGKFTYSGMNGQLFGGGTFTMTAEQSKSCS